jgi:Protein of unknown function (DUF1549)/Protein of unknown function (DUF1553)/Bacterial Ig-like domain (group 2)
MRTLHTRLPFIFFVFALAYILAHAVLTHSQNLQSAPYHKPRSQASDDWVEKTTASKMGLKPVSSHAVMNEKLKTFPLKKLEIYPNAIALKSKATEQRIIVEGTFADGHQEDLTDKVKITSSDPRIARYKEGIVLPASNGKSVLRATLDGVQASAGIEVTQYAAPLAWSFRNDVIPVMTKVGCNSGPCHGAAAGKNGFKLTLRGFDPETDYYTLTHQSLARRTNRMEPAKSLILLKPTLTIPHGGGHRFDVGSPEYKIMSGWIADGMPPPTDKDPRVTTIEVYPEEASLRPGAQQQLTVLAKFSDGHVQDVTRWVKYESNNDGVASVDQLGHVTVHGYGEVPITAWYQSHVKFASMRIPYPHDVAPSVYRSAARHNYIDDYVLDHLKALHIPPSPQANDSEFIRRAYLDEAGILPTAREVEAFLKDTSPNKRNQLIEKLIKTPEFVDYWAYKWSDLLLVSSDHLSTEGMWSYYHWIRDGVRTDKPWNQFVREILTATGNARTNGAVNYWVIHRSPTDIAESTAVSFLGINITCAHCHNHPLAKWTQKDYYGMANLFARVRMKTGENSGSRPGIGVYFRDVTVYSSPVGQYYMDDRFSRPLPPKPLDAQPITMHYPGDPRVYFADWLTSPQNPYFARSLVNRVWRSLMGRGIIEPPDDLRATNPPTNAKLLDALTQDFIRHHFDVDYLIRTIMESATYQTSSKPLPDNASDGMYYSHFLIRRLPAEVLLDAYSKVLQVPEKFDGYPVGTRALQLPDTSIKSYFLTTFGRPLREQPRSSERSAVPTITQALHIINGDTLNNKLRDPTGAIAMFVKLGVSDEDIIRYLYLSSFCRFPTKEESHALLEGLRTAERSQSVQPGDDSRQDALRDMAWAVLTSQEFMFDH